jgi:hypothetical protein
MFSPLPDTTSVIKAAASIERDAGSFSAKAEIMKIPTKSKK